MTRHEPNGRTVCIHSVCVDQAFRRQKIATRLLQEFISRARAANEKEVAEGKPKLYERIALISHDYLIPLYEKTGFKLRGESNIRHGEETWFEMMLEL
jgi:cyclin-dependent kinase-like